jgi:hypothetical protein
MIASSSGVVPLSSGRETTVANPRQASTKPSQSHTVALAKKQMLPLVSEKNQPDETPLWKFMGSPVVQGVMGGGVGGLLSTAGALMIGLITHTEKNQLIKKTLGFGVAGAVLGGGFAAWRTSHANKVYAAWMDALGTEHATLGDVRQHDQATGSENTTQPK